MLGGLFGRTQPDDSDEETPTGDEEPLSDDDDDDEGRETVKDPRNLSGLLEHISLLESQGVTIVHAKHCSNYWYMYDTVLPLQHHGLVFKLSNGNYLRMHLLRDGLAWKSYDMSYPDAKPPAMPDNVAMNVDYRVNNAPVGPLKKYCAENSVWSWPQHDCEQFAKGALRLIGVGEQERPVAEKVSEWLQIAGSTMAEAIGDLGQLAQQQHAQFIASQQAGPGGPRPMIPGQRPTAPPSPSEEALRRAKEIYEAKMRQLQIDENKVQSFLKANGFGTKVNKGRRKRLTKTYPLHVAAKHNNLEMVRLLLRFGAIPIKKNTYKRTAYDVARKYDRQGSHRQVIDVLQDAMYRMPTGVPQSAARPQARIGAGPGQLRPTVSGQSGVTSSGLSGVTSSGYSGVTSKSSVSQPTVFSTHAPGTSFSPTTSFQAAPTASMSQQGSPPYGSRPPAGTRPPGFAAGPPVGTRPPGAALPPGMRPPGAAAPAPGMAPASGFATRPPGFATRPPGPPGQAMPRPPGASPTGSFLRVG